MYKSELLFYYSHEKEYNSVTIQNTRRKLVRFSVWTGLHRLTPERRLIRWNRSYMVPIGIFFAFSCLGPVFMKSLVDIYMLYYPLKGEYIAPNIHLNNNLHSGPRSSEGLYYIYI